uniref:Major facilitator superfamily (MFS) profile domain-containing protein n=1 Tax=Lutzomyia longipalpis TaxID=7200 RepID=A0A1B0C846_LUTLO
MIFHSSEFPSWTIYPVRIGEIIPVAMPTVLEIPIMRVAGHISIPCAQLVCSLSVGSMKETNGKSLESINICAEIEAHIPPSFSANPLDFAPNYAAILIGISQTVSVIPGIVSPILTGYIVRNGSQDEWQTVFYVSAGFCVPAVVAYMIFGKGKLQKWATTATTEAIDEQIKLPIN